MNLGITLKNYRCFPHDLPASMRLESGFTALVGSNNSGKSSLLKFFWEFRGLFDQLRNLNALYGGLEGKRQGLNFPNTVRDHTEVFCNRNAESLSVEFDFSRIDPSELPKPLAPFPTKLVIDMDRATRGWIAKASVRGHPLLTNDTNLTSRENTAVVTPVRGGEALADLGAIVAVCGRLSQCVYIPAYRNAINVGSAQPYFDIQTGQAFISQWRAWQTGDVVEFRRAARRLTDTIRDIFGYGRLEVNAANNNETLELFIDGESYMLPELGSGIAQFLMVLANAATKKPPFVFIDEPELNLHPSLQRAFLKCLASYTTEGVVFATHNLGLALAQADRTYSVQRIDHGRSEIHRYGETPRLPEFMGELSFAGYKELGFDKVLLVEGVTDLRAIQHFLSFYGKQDKVVLLPLGGNALINGRRRDELQEVQRICPYVHALIDSEKADAAAPLESARDAFVATCAGLEPAIPCHVLARRSLENYFTDAAVKAVLGPRSAALGHYDRVLDKWKVDNWRIAQEMNRADIDGTDLGIFLDLL